MNFDYTMSPKEIENLMLSNMQGKPYQPPIRPEIMLDETDELEKSVSVMDDRAYSLIKSYTDMRGQLYSFPREPEIMPYPQNGRALFEMVNRVPTLRTCVDNLIQQHYRIEPELKPRFQSKCPVCGTEYREYHELCDNPYCVLQGAVCIGPDVAQKKGFEDWSEKVNRNGQSYLDLAKLYTYDVHISDNPVVLSSFDYVFDPLSGLVVGKKLLEMTTCPADAFRLIQDEHGVPGGLFFTCIEHRDVKVHRNEEVSECRICGKQLVNVTAVTIKRGSSTSSRDTADVEHLLIDGEWFLKPFYTQTINYGVSPVYTVWMLSSAIWYMDNIELNTYKMGRPPKSLLLFNSYNADSVKSQIRSEFNRAKENRNYPPTLVYPFEGKTPATILNMLPTDSELQNLEHRKEHRDRISAMFGVMPTFQADASTGGGLNNEGMEITVTLIRLESLHKWEEQGLFEYYMKSLGITDWVLKYPPLKEEDRMAVISRKEGNLKMLQTVLQMGADYRIKNEEDLEFEIVGKLRAPMMTGQTSGMNGQQESPGLQWDLSDWMTQDQTFRFSLNKSDVVGEIVAELVTSLRIVSSYPPETRSGAIRQVIYNTLDRFNDHLRQSLARYIRTGISFAGQDYETAEIDPDRLQELLDAYVIQHPPEFYEDLWFAADKFSDTLEPRWVDDIVGVLTPQLENVLDTESTAFVNVGLAEGFRMSDPEDVKYDYYWSGPDYSPGRSTLVCQAIKGEFDKCRAKKGRVSLADAQGIVAEEGRKPHGKEKAFNLNRPLLPHFRCRHRLIGTPVLHKSIIYIDNPSDAPPGITVHQGPKGGLFYETGHGDGHGDTDAADDKTPSDVQGADADVPGGEGSGGADYKAIGVRRGDERWEIKYYLDSDRAGIEQLLAQQGYKLDGDVYVQITEAVPAGGGAG